MKVGDVFTVPVSDHRVAVGQVLSVRLDSELLVVVFEGAVDDSEASIARVSVGKPPALVALTLDAFFSHKRWRVVGNRPPRRDIPMPTYKVAISPGAFVEEDVHGNQVRQLSPREADALPFRKVVAPVRVDRATRALLGDGVWQSSFEELLPR